MAGLGNTREQGVTKAFCTYHCMCVYIVAIAGVSEKYDNDKQCSVRCRKPLCSS
jgi:hypothetical protein